MTTPTTPEGRRELKACPFCGEQAEVEHSYHEDNHRYPRDFWHVRVCCTACDCRQPWSRYGEQEQRNPPAEAKAKAEADAVTLWNTRPEEIRLLAALEEAEGRLEEANLFETENDAAFADLDARIEELTARAEAAEQRGRRLREALRYTAALAQIATERRTLRGDTLLFTGRFSGMGSKSVNAILDEADAALSEEA